jgi:hypothetical protein
MAPSAGSSELSTGLILRHNWQKVRDDAPAEIATEFLEEQRIPYRRD